MKKILTRIVIGLVLLGGAICVATWFIPSKVHVERSITINAPAEAIFPHVNDLKAWEQWSPWYEVEPTAQYTYGEQTVGVGATSTWKGEKVGEGTQVIMSSTPNSEISTALDFGDQGEAMAFWKFEEAGNSTNVIWGFDTDVGLSPIGKVFALLMDSMVGGDYEKGLQNLKQICEASSGEASEVEAEDTVVDDNPETEPAEAS